MPVNVRISDDHNYLVYTMTDPLDMGQLLEAYRLEKQHRDSVDHVMHSIIDMSNLRRIPPNWLLAKAGPGMTHPRSGELLFVGVSVGIKIVVETVLKIMRYQRIRFFNTRQEADAYMSVLLNRSQDKPAVAGRR